MKLITGLNEKRAILKDMKYIEIIRLNITYLRLNTPLKMSCLITDFFDPLF